MSNPKRRQDVRAWREAERRQAALTTPRHYRASVALMGIGLRELRIAVLPSFDVADGVRLEVSFHSLTSSCYVQWVQGHAPAPWNGLNELVDEALALFRRAPQTPV